MANRHPSALKRNRQNEKRRAHNREIRSRMRTQIRKAQEAIAAKDVPAADAELRSAVKELTKAASKGVIHRNAASRRVSRLSTKVSALKKATA